MRLIGVVQIWFVSLSVHVNVWIVFPFVVSPFGKSRQRPGTWDICAVNSQRSQTQIHRHTLVFESNPVVSGIEPVLRGKVGETREYFHVDEVGGVYVTTMRC